MDLLVLILGILLLLVLIIKFKFNTYVSLIITAVVVALGLGMAPAKIATSIQTGIGSQLGELALVFGFGAMLGRLVADAGGAYRIAHTLINAFGRRGYSWLLFWRHSLSVSRYSLKWGLSCWCRSCLRLRLKQGPDSDAWDSNGGGVIGHPRILAATPSANSNFHSTRSVCRFSAGVWGYRSDSDCLHCWSIIFKTRTSVCS